MIEGRRPHFLEIFLPNLSFNRLKVPSKFVEHLGRQTSGPLSLIGPSGNIWHVNLTEYNGHLFFRDGWPTFVKDHSIQCGDTLIFRYDGNSSFTVQIFDQSSCEKDEAFYANCSQGAFECNGNMGKKRERDMEAFMQNLVAEKKMRGSWVPVHLDLPTGDEEQKLKMSTKKDQKLKETVVSWRGARTKNISKASEQSVVLAIPALRGPDGFASAVNFCVRKVVSKVKKTRKNEEKTDTKKMPNVSKFIESRAAHYITSTFPYFIRVMRYSNISGNCTLKIPSSFSSVHLPKCRIKVTLMNLNGDCWSVNSIPTAKRHTTMHTICGGWTAFVRGNSIRIEDVCIFELVGNLEMRVRILRLSMEGLDCQIGSGSDDINDAGSGGRRLEIVENGAQDTVVHHSNDIDQTYVPCAPHKEKHEKKSDKKPYMLQEAVSSFGKVEGSDTIQRPDCASPSFTGIIDDSIPDELLESNARGTMSYQTSSSNQVDLQASHTGHIQAAAEVARDHLSFTSPFPSFMKVMMSSNVSGSFTLAVPRKFAAVHLPCYRTDVALRNLRGDSWTVVAARYGKQTKFCGGWMSFVRMNDVKVGNVCVFELLDEKVLQVHVFEGSRKGPQCVHNEAVADDSIASVESLLCDVLPEI